MKTTSQPSAQVGTKLLFENDRVRVWDLRLAPGERTGLHRHETDYLYVVIGGGTLQTVHGDGRRDAPRRMEDGEVHFRAVEGQSVHEAVNVGQQEWRNIVIELKQPG
jgi:predicted metal-dependent enzyme (double-stranded beta helix superfamily)